MGSRFGADPQLAGGELDRLAASLVRHCDRAVILAKMKAGRIACTALVGRSCSGALEAARALGELLASFEFALECAAFASVLHRQFVPGSDRRCEAIIGSRGSPSCSCTTSGNGVAASRICPRSVCSSAPRSV